LNEILAPDDNIVMNERPILAVSLECVMMLKQDLIIRKLH